MSTQTGKWREEQILIICPGSQTTMAQMGCTELTPPALRVPTRMFKDDETDDWRPYYTYKRKKATIGAAAGLNGVAKKDEDEWEFVEDPDSAEGAVYPIQGGRIANMDAFLAFLEHVHSLLTTTYHNTPIMLMASPQWTRPDCETLSQYIFEKTKTPSLCLIHSGVATQYGLKWPHMTVVDIGFEKVDVTCIHDSRVVNHINLPDTLGDGRHKGISGGEVFTQRLIDLLKDKNFTHDMAEQLKKSSACEVLPYMPELPQLMELPSDGGPTAASIPPPSAILQAAAETLRIDEPPTAPVGEVEDGMTNGEDKADDNDGVLDVASIVTSGQTKEFLAKKDKEKADKAKVGKRGKGQEAEAATAKPVRLPNSKRLRTVFHYEEFVQEDHVRPKDSAPKDQPVAAEPSQSTAVNPALSASGEAPEVKTADGQPETGEGQAKPDEPKSDAPKSDAPKSDAPKSDAPKPDEPFSLLASLEPPTTAPVSSAPETFAPETEQQIKRVRRDIDIGLERFTFADRVEIDRIVTTIYRTIQGIEDMYMRPSCWENIVFVGNGCRIRGLKENILQTLNARHLIAPSTATIFTSELPSNLATPSGTGSQTPTGSFTAPPHQLPTSSSVNPLLQAATTASLALPPASLGTPGGPASNAGDTGHSTHFHSQTPTNIKLAQLPTYLSEWTKNGFEEAMFLGAQVAARLAFCVHNMDAQGHESQRLMSLSRVDYNELGPKGIRTHSMLG